MNASFEKFFEKSLRALSSQNWTWDGVESEGEEEEDASKRKGFQDGVDFRLGAIEQLTKERERKKGTNRKAPKVQYKNIKKWRYVCMKNA